MQKLPLGVRKIHALSWDKVCTPKQVGGLGPTEGFKWNKASLGKYLWAMMFKQDSLWLKWVHAIYIKSRDFWSDNLRGDCSWYWRKLWRFLGILTTDILRN